MAVFEGVEIRDASGGLQIYARRGVVLATGGFSHDADASSAFLSRQPLDGFRHHVRRGPGTACSLRMQGRRKSLVRTIASPAYWVPASLFQRQRRQSRRFSAYRHRSSKARPIADQRVGASASSMKRVSYHEFVLAMLRDSNDSGGSAFHLVCDRTFLWTYGLGRIQPFTRGIRQYINSGELIEAPTFVELAKGIGVEELTLDTPSIVTTLMRARDSTRNSDVATQSINVILATQAIYQTPALLRLSRHHSMPCVSIPRISARPSGYGPTSTRWLLGKTALEFKVSYICGNDMNSIMNGNYPGPGITLGPALTFGYIAGRRLAQEA